LCNGLELIGYRSCPFAVVGQKSKILQNSNMMFVHTRDENLRTEDTSQWWQAEDPFACVEQRLHEVRTDIHDTELHVQATDKPLFAKVKLSVDIITQSLDTYGYIALGYNGGKDSVVLLNLLIMALIVQVKKQRGEENDIIHCTKKDAEHALQTLRKNVLCFHFNIEDSFAEMDDFLRESAAMYGFDVVYVDGSKGYKRALEQIVEQSPQFKGVLMGTRRIDPHGQTMHYFEKTTKGWPDLMRICPVLEWDYVDIWHFLLQLSIPYCKLYDIGYTSLGSTKDTIPNPSLKRNDQTYKPAYKLLDGSLERAGRLSNSA
jgi:FAD synthetase